MAAPVLVRGTPGRHYVWPPGKVPPDLIVPSVTTILDEYSKPWLGPWMAKSAANYAADNLEVLNKLDRDAIADLVARASKRESAPAMGRGTVIHEAIETHLRGDRVRPKLVDEYPQIAAAIDFLDRCVERVLMQETTFFSETYQYAGTGDMIPLLAKAAPVPKELHGKQVILDWKSGKRVYPEVALQLSAYANADFLANEDGEAEDMPDLEAGVVVHLTDSGQWTARTVHLTDKLFRAFVALRTLTQYRAYVEPDALSKPWTDKQKKQTADKETAEE